MSNLRGVTNIGLERQLDARSHPATRIGTLAEIRQADGIAGLSGRQRHDRRKPQDMTDESHRISILVPLQIWQKGNGDDYETIYKLPDGTIYEGVISGISHD